MKTDNELIAEFMGATIHKEVFGGSGSCSRTWTRKEWPEPLYASEMEYESSWDWLMPVVEKIETMHLLIEIRRDECTISHLGSIDDEYPWLINFKDITTYLRNDKMGAVYAALLEFIKWYKTERRSNRR